MNINVVRSNNIVGSWIVVTESNFYTNDILAMVESVTQCMCELCEQKCIQGKCSYRVTTSQGNGAFC